MLRTVVGILGALMVSVTPATAKSAETAGIAPAATTSAPTLTATQTAPAAPTATSDVAGPPSEPECLPLGAGTTGVLLVGGSVPSSDQLTGQPGGLAEPVVGDLARRLPDRIVFKDDRNTFGRDYAFALRDGRIYVRPATLGVGNRGEPWRRLELPACLDGHVQAISADHRLLVALGPDRQVYSHDMPGGDLSAERWTWRWGPYFWTGSGLRMFHDVREWATSEFTSAEWFRDTSGREHHPIGVATVYLLRGDGRRITYLDPWLPQDESREVCGPRRGTVPMAGISGSGSTVFVAVSEASCTPGSTTSTSPAPTRCSATTPGSAACRRTTPAGSCRGRAGSGSPSRPGR